MVERILPEEIFGVLAGRDQFLHPPAQSLVALAGREDEGGPLLLVRQLESGLQDPLLLV